MQHASEGRQFYLFDALGSVSNLTNTSGLVQARYQYDAFGNLRAEAGSSFNRFTFTGHEKDTETGLYYFKARFYDPDTGRFLNQDPYLGEINTPPSLHRYLYAYSNPVVYVDLTGNFPLIRQLADFFQQRSDDVSEGLVGIEQEYGSTMSTRTVAAAGGIGAALFQIGASVANLADAALDSQAANLRYVPGLNQTEIVKESVKATDRRSEAISDIARTTKSYYTQDDLGGALVRDVGGIAESAGNYLDDVFVKGKLTATASWSGGAYEAAAGGIITRAQKLGQLGKLGKPDAEPEIIVESHEGQGVDIPDKKGPDLRTLEGVASEVNRNADIAVELTRRAVERGRITDSAQAFGTRAHKLFEGLNNRLDRRLVNQDSPLSVISEEFRDAAGDVTSRRASGSIGADVKILDVNIPDFVKVLDLKTHGGTEILISPSRQQQFIDRFGVPAEEIFRQR